MSHEVKEEIPLWYTDHLQNIDRHTHGIYGVAYQLYCSQPPRFDQCVSPCLRSSQRGWSLQQTWAAVCLRCFDRNLLLWCWTPPQRPACFTHNPCQSQLTLTNEHLRFHSYLICIVREVDFVEDLRCLMLDGFHFHQMRGVLSWSISVTMTFNKVCSVWSVKIIESKLKEILWFTVKNL